MDTYQHPVSTSATLVSSDNSPRSSLSQTNRLSGTHFVDIEPSSHAEKHHHQHQKPTRRGSTASRASHLAEDDIYPDLTEEERQLKREHTLEQLKQVYSKHADDGELEQPNDAASLKDVDPELVTW